MHIMYKIKRISCLKYTKSKAKFIKTQKHSDKMIKKYYNSKRFQYRGCLIGGK